jgi:hypothetical protein
VSIIIPLSPKGELDFKMVYKFDVSLYDELLLFNTQLYTSLQEFLVLKVIIDLSSPWLPAGRL